jgi:hypothetical protein
MLRKWHLYLLISTQARASFLLGARVPSGSLSNPSIGDYIVPRDEPMSP